ncbi:MAG: hypothetical protein JSR82_05660 [Verrucomicrobia bacterium]|nr:hypothetical protein [Verrucomicrobiota bacterium]
MKLLFDENFGRPLVGALAEVVKFSREPHELRHIGELRTLGGPDDEWIPQIAGGDWLVVSGDRGKQGGPKLPRLCLEAGVTHVLVSGRMHNSPQFEKARAVLSVWPELMKAAEGPRGERYSLRYQLDLRPILVHLERTHGRKPPE